MIRHHRLLELYLAQTLGLHVDAVHDEADRLEHVLSEELEARIDSALGYPTHDPHGDPIPNAEARVAASSLAAEEPALERPSSSSRTNGLTFAAAAVLLGDDRVVLERLVRRVERVAQLVALEDVVVGAAPRRCGGAAG